MNNINFDDNRKNLTGIPEVILAEPKTITELETSIEGGLEKLDRLLITRIQSEQVLTIKNLGAKFDKKVKFDSYQRTAIIGKITSQSPLGVALISGGTSDNPIVEEAKFTLQYLGYSSYSYLDVGVAGIHRHEHALEEISENNDIKGIIVFAGQEGALFSVISAQTKLPMVAVPISTGYGYGGEGEAALFSALQSCSPGVVTVNIDNGFGAAVFLKKVLDLYK